MFDYDYIIVGSGFGGSVAGLRLVEKGYRVLMVEKGREIVSADLPKTNWDLKRWLWLPVLGFRGFFRMSFFPHVTVLSGVAVGGGSVTYASTHPVPPPSFFEARAWRDLADWSTELAPHYARAKQMLGVTQNPRLAHPDLAVASVAKRRGHADSFRPTDVAIFFGTPGEEVPDPYFDGQGPPRSGCRFCGGCMLGCRHGAKNTLDKNYLHLARQRGLELRPNLQVTAVRALDGGGYRVEWKPAQRWGGARDGATAQHVILAGGVLGTVDLLLRMKADPRGLPKLSDRVGLGVRTNSEALIGVLSRRRDTDLSKGVAIGSVYETDPHSHIEAVRYSDGSGFFRLLMAPHVAGAGLFERLLRLAWVCLRHPIAVLRGFFIHNMARQSTILLFMRTLESTLRLKRAWHGGLTTRRERGPAPVASIPEATELAHEVAQELDGIPFSLLSETLFNIPTTAHILGGATMGADAKDGVIDRDHQVFGYDGLYVMDGASVSANPGVNPSLTICALAERAIAKIPAKHALERHEGSPTAPAVRRPA